MSTFPTEHLALSTAHFGPGAALWLLCGALGGYLLVLFTSPMRASLRDGLRCIRRYSALWITLGAFGFAYALFRLAVDAYFFTVLPLGERRPFQGLRAAWHDPDLWLTGSSESLWHLPPGALREVARESVLPAFESLAGIFNCLVPTFPLAAFAALLFVINWQGHRAVLFRALRQRFGVRGFFVHAGLLLCALASVAKPLLYIFARALEPHFWTRWSPIADWLSFLFEYLFGVCVQIYLLLLAYCWVRGLTFSREHLLDFAIRRFSFVMRWAAVVMLLSSAFIHGPLILGTFEEFGRWFPADWERMESRLLLARLLLSGVLLLFATVQITLTFHSESLLRALADHARFLARHWWPFTWFLLVAGLHFYLLHALTRLCTRGLGADTALGVAWGLLVPWLGGVVGAWLLASWLCFFKRCDAGRAHEEDWIKY